jgi:hypothetical protein
MTRDPDILETVYRAALAGRPLADIRREVGGQQVYIPLRTASDRERIAAELRESTAAAVARRHGISERHAYRLRRLG